MSWRPYTNMKQEIGLNAIAASDLHGESAPSTTDVSTSTSTSSVSDSCSSASSPTDLTSPEPELSDAAPYDLIVVGFGPASLSIAIAILDTLSPESRRSQRILFLEKKSEFSWHGGMLLPHARMQISFIKDFATMRDPTSKFTFMNYLHTKGRLLDFVNLGTFYPLREEYEDYMRWCADLVQQDAECVVYGETVVGLSVPEQEYFTAEKIPHLAVTSVCTYDPAQKAIRLARNVVLCPGARPQFPSCFPAELTRRIFHSAEFMYKSSELLALASQSSAAEYAVAVVGAGQSAAEIAQYLHANLPLDSHVDMIFPAGALRPSDDSPFVNEIFNPEAVDGIYSLSDDRRRAMFDEYKSTNYSVVRSDLLETLYAIAYEQKLPGRTTRLGIKNLQIVEDVCVIDKQGAEKVILKLRDQYNSGHIETAEYDFVIAATGYDKSAIFTDLLSGLSRYVPASEVTVDRGYRVKLDENIEARLWVQGCNEATHGLSDTLLSIMAVRGKEIVDQIFDK
ncbi:L-lysine 6-monooxygenase (NADPH-requiring)-domain-containing protein [Lipomyces orientalis]|uniref:L-lysine 6-monooxygenase (NADPH-requiring)-domain-containing protein n=1 Tax=Lipomyces orientalis TaxID=1233043 RepID=A0ACC3TTE9_9ASCO